MELRVIPRKVPLVAKPWLAEREKEMVITATKETRSRYSANGGLLCSFVAASSVRLMETVLLWHLLQWGGIVSMSWWFRVLENGQYLGQKGRDGRFLCVYISSEKKLLGSHRRALMVFMYA